jgi:hypothetical protein
VTTVSTSSEQHLGRICMIRSQSRVDMTAFQIKVVSVKVRALASCKQVNNMDQIRELCI